jgi:ankyrin repeat protein
MDEDGELQMMLRAIEALLRANRQAAALADGFGRTPLHLACMNSDTPCGVQATRVLLSHFALWGSGQQQQEGLQLGAVLSRKDVEGRTPLHWLLLRSDAIPMDALEAMLNSCPQLVSIKDDVRETPGDICRRRQSSILNHKEVLERIEQVANSLTSSPSPMDSPLSARGPQRRLVGLKDLSYSSTGA